MVTVEHYKGTPLSNLRSTLYTVANMIFLRSARIDVEFNHNILGAHNGSDNWLKIAGWRSGFNTKTNHEDIAAFRVLKDRVQFCHYIRRHERLRFDDFDGIDEMYAFDEFVLDTFSSKTYHWTCVIDRQWKQNIPAFPWAEGGGIIPRSDFHYELQISKP